MTLFTHSMANGVDSTIITTSSGMVSVPRIDCYYNDGVYTTDPDQSAEIAQNEAHAYRELTQGLEGCPYTTNEDSISSRKTVNISPATIAKSWPIVSLNTIPEIDVVLILIKPNDRSKPLLGNTISTRSEKVIFISPILEMDHSRWSCMASRMEQMKILSQLPDRKPPSTRRPMPILAIKYRRTPQL